MSIIFFSLSPLPVLKRTRSSIGQCYGLKICRTTILNFIKLCNRPILSLRFIEMFSRVHKNESYKHEIGSLRAQN